MWRVATLVSSLICLIETKNIPQNDTAVLISKYSKVARWGANENDTIQMQEGRSNSGHARWSHRSDVNIIGGQSAVYRHSSKPSSKVDNRKVEKIPAVGEVMQDRFNPRPYFAYKVSESSASSSVTYGPPNAMQVAAPAPAPPAAPPAPPSPSSDFGSFPAVFNVVPSTAKSVDLYTSPYSSYNPPPLKPDDTPPSDTYPPTKQDDYAAPAPMDDVYGYKTASKSPYVSLGPPLAYQPQADDDMSSSHDVDAPPSDHMHDGAPKYPPKSEDDIYYPSDDGDSHDYPVDHPPKDYKPDDMDSDMGMGMGDDMGGGMAPDMGGGMAPDMGQDMTMDLAPPPSDDQRGHHFPQYLYDGHHYDGHHYDDHIYEEIPHTTTEATEDKRVSTHYSYYYLGRKLWYIPLYFSVYFIVYVTVLILKSIARHKIKYKHKFTSSRSSRKIDTDRADVDELHGRVNDGLDKANKMYAAFAM